MKKHFLTLGIIAVSVFYSSLYAQDLAYLHKTSVTTSEEIKPSNIKGLIYEVEWLKTNEVEFVNMEYVDRHFLGSDIAKKRHLLDETFVRRVQVAPGNPAQRSEITKPVLYQAVNDIERHLRRALRRGQIDENQAKKHMNIVLDVVLNTYYLETDELEAKVRACNCAEELISLFVENTHVVYTVAAY